MSSVCGTITSTAKLKYNDIQAGWAFATNFHKFPFYWAIDGRETRDKKFPKYKSLWT